MTTTLRNLGVAILAGGLGTRLRPAVADRPKVLAPVAGRPFLCYLLDQLSRCSVREVVLLTGHRAGQVRAALGEVYKGMRLVYSVEERPLGTGGALRLALPCLTASRVLLLNGDSYCDVDLQAFHLHHETRGADVSMALCEAEDTTRFGRVRIDRSTLIVGFQEKGGGGGRGWINAGIYLLETDMIGSIPADRPLSLERDLFPLWLQSHSVFGYRTGGRFLDIGAPESYAQAEAFFQEETSVVLS